MLTKATLLLQLILLLIQTKEYLCASNSSTITAVYGNGTLYEGPCWSDVENALYWVDVVEQKVLRLDVDSGNVTTRDIGYGDVTLVTTIKGFPKLLLVAVRTGLYLLAWDDFEGDTSLRLLTSVDAGLPYNRINDGKVDANGRIWFGTMGNQSVDAVELDRGSLYRADKSSYWNPNLMVRPVTVSNGIVWSLDNTTMYYIDSWTMNVDQFNFDLDSGRIWNRTTLFSFAANNVTGIPDGMTIDSDGNLWVACFKGSQVININSTTGELIDQYTLPVSKVTSVMWGGANLSTLYVTTSRENLNDTELAEQPLAGSLFAIEGTGITGVKQNQFVFANADTY